MEIVKQGHRVDGEFVNWFRSDTKKERNRCATAAGFMPLIIVLYKRKNDVAAKGGNLVKQEKQPDSVNQG